MRSKQKGFVGIDGGDILLFLAAILGLIICSALAGVASVNQDCKDKEVMEISNKFYQCQEVEKVQEELYKPVEPQ